MQYFASSLGCHIIVQLLICMPYLCFLPSAPSLKQLMISILSKLRHNLARRHYWSASYFICSSQKIPHAGEVNNSWRIQPRPTFPVLSKYPLFSSSSQVSFSSQARASALPSTMAEQESMDTSTTFRRLPTTVKPTHYSLTLKPNLNDFTFEGTQQINLEVRCYSE